MDKKAEDGYADDIGQKVYGLTWQGKLWGKGGAIAWSCLRYTYLKAMGKELQGLSALSSTYYTAWGNALARARQNWALAIFWTPKAIWALCKALKLSDEAEARSGLKNMTVGQLDIRASILAAAFFRARHLDDASECIKEALTREDISDDNLALIKTKLAEIYNRTGEHEKAGDIYCKVINMTGVKATTSVRVRRSAAWHLFKWGKGRETRKQVAKEFLRVALSVAKENNFGDQVIKIKSLMKKMG